jgi:peptidylprolyl isomerase
MPLLAIVAVLAFSPALAGETTTPSTHAILAASKPSEWRVLDPADTLYMDLAGHHRVIIELAPKWAPQHVANIKTLVRSHYFDGTSVYRVQDNFVAQWGDPDGDDPAKAKPMGKARHALPPEFTRPFKGLAHVTPLTDGDVYAPRVGFARGLPMAWNPKNGKAWLVQCYGMVGVARDTDPESGNGNTLYVPIGQAPRQIDHQLAVVGRVVQGMQWLSALPRGPEPMGVYTDPDQRTPIVSVRLASQVPAAKRSKLKVLRTDSKTFERLVEAKRNRHNAFYTEPPGHIGICNVSQPVHEVE